MANKIFFSDWCISRQLWWGHRIPAYFARVKATESALDKNDPANNHRWIVARTRELALKIAAEKLGVNESEVCYFLFVNMAILYIGHHVWNFYFA